MGLMTVKEYAKSQNVSVQSVYARITSGAVKYQIKDGVKMIEVESKAVKDKVDTKCKAKVELLKARVKALKTELELVRESSTKSYDHLEKMFNMVLQIKQVSAPMIEAKIVKKKKSKRRKKKRGQG